MDTNIDMQINTKKRPIVSIIMAAYNAEKYIVEAIESVLFQTYSNWELIITDDFSNDETSKIIDEYKRKIIVLNQFVWIKILDKQLLVIKPLRNLWENTLLYLTQTILLSPTDLSHKLNFLNPIKI